MTKNVALITGSSRGLGLALARELAQDGWSLILDARGSAALQAVERELTAITQVIAIAGDITDSAHRVQLADTAHKLGGVDVLINNASTLGISPRPNLLEYPLEGLETVFRTNVIAPLALIQALNAVSALKSAARIINVTSDAGVEPYAGWGGYGASKAAFEHLSAILAAERPDWRIYWIDPGDMQTQMHQEAFPGEDISDRALPEESVPGFLRLINGDLPSGRYQASKLSKPNQEVQSQVRGMRLTLTVADFERAAALYRDGLGLPVIDQWIDETSKGVLLGAGTATLELVNKAQAAEVDAIEGSKIEAGQARLAFDVSSEQLAAAALIEHGATALSNAVLTSWHHLNQRFQAPHGVHEDIQLTLSEVVTPTTKVE
ncbi:MAG: SDR family NAD(P)-dependent oxidoreductase [Anaerolineae bacterium]|nr:SDR family NAD(P)-dependent oxidoreductase [Anaerolineae bacterium]